jgi:hypothetical protein
MISVFVSIKHSTQNGVHRARYLHGEGIGETKVDKMAGGGGLLEKKLYWKILKLTIFVL